MFARVLTRAKEEKEGEERIHSASEIIIHDFTDYVKYFVKIFL